MRKCQARNLLATVLVYLDGNEEAVVLQANEAVTNQIVYLTYILRDQPEEIDAALLTPVRDTLQRVAHDTGLDAESKHLVESLGMRLERWTQLGLVISRESAQRVLSLMRALSVKLQRHAGPADDQPSPVARRFLDPLRS